LSELDLEFMPFENESDVLSIGQLTIENRTDRITFTGGIDITCDKAGLTQALELQTLLNEVVERLQSMDLPEKVILVESGMVKNPFS
jgi:hypothetical protein